MQSAPTVEAPADAPPILDGSAPATPRTTRDKRIANLKRFPKGTRPPQLLTGRKGPSKRDLAQRIKATLGRKDEALLQELAESIIQGAIDREPACLAFLAPRLWPIEQGATSGRIISEGIKLEVVDGKASVTLLKQTQREGVDQEPPVCDSVALDSAPESHGESPAV
jgi:hypothetical protein